MSSTTAGTSSAAPRASSADAQSSVSATPGTLVRSASRSRWTKPTIWRASRSGAAGTREHDLELALEARVVDPVVEAAALQGVVNLAGPVAGQDHPGREHGPDRANLGHRHLEVGQDLEQVRLELLVRPVDLVDQQDRGHAVVGIERLEERPADQEVGPEDVVGRGPGGFAACLEQPDLEHLARVVPLVDGARDVEPLVALQADERSSSVAARTLASSVLPTPASPSRSSGRSSSRARKTAVATERSAM